MDKIGFGFSRKLNVLKRIKTGWTTIKTRLSLLLVLLFMVNLVGCGNNPPEVPETPLPPVTPPAPIKRISEVSPPTLIQKLHQSLDAYQPEVTILSPKPNQILEDDTVTVKLQVNGLPLFKDPQYGLGPHLQVILDNQPDVTVYDPNESVTFSNLQPGTHTLRVLAAYPWDETYKNAGAFAETTFHVFTKIAKNNPDPELPLLTYNRPQGTYGAEPILLDFYLANAPLHIVAQENPTDEIVDWQIRATVNGESFMIDRWQPIYIKGLKPGKNWVQLEYLDEQGNPVENIYNNTARVITYDPTLNDTLAQLIKGELPFAQVRGIADPNILIQELIETVEPEQTPVVEPEAATPEPEVTPVPSVEPEVVTEPEAVQDESSSIEEASPEPETPVTEPETSEIESAATVTEPETPEVETVPAIEPETLEIKQVPVEEPAAKPKPTSVEPESITEEQPVTEPVPAVVEASHAQPDVASPSLLSQIQQFFKGFQLPFFNSAAVETQPIETLPEIVEEVPVPEPTSDLQPGETPELLPEVESLKPTSTDIFATEENASESSVETVEAEPEIPTVIEEVSPEATPTEVPVAPLEGDNTPMIPEVTAEI